MKELILIGGGGHCKSVIDVIEASNTHRILGILDEKTDKAKNDIFYWHTGYPGGIKQRSKGQILDGDHPQRVVEKAVERMLPRGPLGRRVFKNLRVYAGTEHPHEAQKPQVIDVAAMNEKNKR